MYLCTRKSGYCAGLHANNTLRKSNLTFKNEEVRAAFFKCVLWVQAKATLKKETLFTHFIKKLKLKCQD